MLVEIEPSVCCCVLVDDEQAASAPRETAETTANQ
jgi:hypothetical protein